MPWCSAGDWAASVTSAEQVRVGRLGYTLIRAGRFLNKKIILFCVVCSTVGVADASEPLFAVEVSARFRATVCLSCRKL